MKVTIKSKKTVLKVKPSGSIQSTDRLRANRESYLENAVEILGKLFKQHASIGLPEVRVSCGFPLGQRGSKKFGGQTWDRKASKDGRAQIFISPLIDETIPVLAALAHELIHATLGNDAGHGSDFKRVARDIGLFGKSRGELPIAGPMLEAFITENVIEKLGQYPHAKLTLEDREKAGIAKETTRMLKCYCPKSGYTIRTSRAWLDKFGAPLSPVTKKAMQIDGYTPSAAVDAA